MNFKLWISICLVAIIALLGISITFQIESRNQRVQEQKQKEASEKVQALALEVQSRIDALHEVKSSWEFQYKITHQPELWQSTNAMYETWSNYLAAFNEADRQLKMTQLDLSLPLPPTKYIDQEVAAGLIERSR